MKQKPVSVQNMRFCRNIRAWFWFSFFQNFNFHFSSHVIWLVCRAVTNSFYLSKELHRWGAKFKHILFLTSALTETDGLNNLDSQTHLGQKLCYPGSGISIQKTRRIFMMLNATKTFSQEMVIFSSLTSQRIIPFQNKKFNFYTPPDPPWSGKITGVYRY